MKKNIKRLVAVLLTLAMVVTSFTSYADPAKPVSDYEITGAEISLNDNHGIDLKAKYKNKKGETGIESIFANDLSFFVGTGDDYEFGKECNVTNGLSHYYTIPTGGTFSDTDSDGVNDCYSYSGSGFYFMARIYYGEPSVDGRITSGKFTVYLQNTSDWSNELKLSVVGRGRGTGSFISQKDSDKTIIQESDECDELYGTQTTLTMDPAPLEKWVGPYTDPDSYSGAKYYFDDNLIYAKSSSEKIFSGNFKDTPAFINSWYYNFEQGESKVITFNFEIENKKDKKLTFNYLNGNQEVVETFEGETLYFPEFNKSEYEDHYNLRWKDDETGNLYTSSEMYTVMKDASFTQIKDLATGSTHKMVIKDLGKGVKAQVAFNSVNYTNDNIFSYQSSENALIKFTSSREVKQIRVLPVNVKFDYDQSKDGFYIDSLPDSDTYIIPIYSHEEEFFDIKNNFDGTMPKVTNDNLEFDVEWLDETGQNVVTQCADNTKYVAHISIKCAKNGITDPTTEIGKVRFNETMYNCVPRDVSGVLFKTFLTKDAALESLKGMYYDADSGIVHIYVPYICLDCITLKINGLKAEGTIDDFSIEYDKAEYALDIYGTSAASIDTDYMVFLDDPVFHDGQKIIWTAVFGYGDPRLDFTQITDVKDFKVLPGTNSTFEVSSCSFVDADDLINELYRNYGSPYTGLADREALLGKMINKNTLSLYAIFETEVKEAPVISSGGSKTYKAIDENKTAKKIAGSGKKGSKRTITPIEGKKVSSVIVRDKNENKIDVTKNADGTYSFIQPASDVTVEVKYKNREIRLYIDDLNAYVDDELIKLDVAPVIRNDRTMLPIRFVAENLGAKVTWNEKDSNYVVIEKEDIKIEITIGSDKAKVNGKEFTLDSVAFIENDRTYLPVRFVSEQLNAIVEWNESKSREVKICER